MAYPSIPRDFGFTEDHELLSRSARRFLDDRCTMDVVRRLAEDPAGHDPALWKEMAQLGWVGLVLSERHGGAGLGSLHLALLLEEMGRCLLPSPFLSTVMAGIAIERGGSVEQRARWCPAIASGETIATLALTEPDGSWELDSTASIAEPVRNGYALHGSKAYVPAAGSASLVVAPFREPDGELALFAIDLPTRSAEVEEEIGVDPTRRCGRIAFNGVRVGPDARIAQEGAATLRAVLVRYWAALAAEMVGAADAVLIRTRDYAVERVQFGRPIGSFQAVKHPLVNMMIGVESARSLSLAAAAALDSVPGQAEVPARMAKAAASESFMSAAHKAVQLHGGYGFTWDADIHFFFKRALWSRGTLGDAVHHRRHLANALIDSRE